MMSSEHGIPVDVTLVGGGMICHDQLLPSLYHLQRLGLVRDLTVCSRTAGTVRALAEAEGIHSAFPGHSFQAVPDYTRNADAKDPDGYREVIDRMEPRQVVFLATPDALHYDMARYALQANQHVLCVKPLVQTCQHAVEIEQLAREKGLFVGIEYHKRFDRRALLARHEYRNGRYGEFRMGEARMIESWYYRHSNFQNWFTCDAYDAFTYVGCHYVDQVIFITGLRPVNVSVIGIKGTFPNGNEGFLWATGRVIFENGGVLNVIDGLGYPDDGAGTNDQGITLFCDDGKRGAVIKHNDQFRGVEHGFVKPAGDEVLFRYVNPDYLKLVPWMGDGLKPVGYGYESVEALVQAAVRVNRAGGGEDSEAALTGRQAAIEAIDAKGLIATPANSWMNELVTEAARHSVLNGGVAVDIQYDPQPQVCVPS